MTEKTPPLRPLLPYTFIALLIITAVTFSFVDTALAGASAGRDIFVQKKCGSCHRVVKPAKRPTLEARLRQKGPDLWYAGSRFKKAFLKEWLASPSPIRPMAYNSLTEKNPGRHASLGAKDAALVTDYLMTLKSPVVKTTGIKAKRNVRGRFIFQKKLGCYGCHRLVRGSKVVGGLSGPTLVGASKRLNPDWIYAYLKDPAAFTPVTPMPDYSRLISDADMKVLAGFVASMK